MTLRTLDFLLNQNVEINLLLPNLPFTAASSFKTKFYLLKMDYTSAQSFLPYLKFITGMLTVHGEKLPGWPPQ